MTMSIMKFEYHMNRMGSFENGKKVKDEKGNLRMLHILLKEIARTLLMRNVLHVSDIIENR